MARPATPPRATKALVAELRAQGVDCSSRRLEDWRRVGLIPRGHRRSLGRGRGTEVVYPDDMAERCRRVAERMLPSTERLTTKGLHAFGCRSVGREPIYGHDVPRRLGGHLAFVDEDEAVTFENGAGPCVGRLGVGGDPGGGMEASNVVDQGGDQRGADTATARFGFADGVVDAYIAALGADAGGVVGVVRAPVPLAPAHRASVPGGQEDLGRLFAFDGALQVGQLVLDG
jgi:hypothetical protein